MNNPPLVESFINTITGDDRVIDIASHVTLRDLFAAAALAGLIAFPDTATKFEDAIEQLPKVAYEYADATLKHREAMHAARQ
jgi:hypothetical protein